MFCLSQGVKRGRYKNMILKVTPVLKTEKLIKDTDSTAPKRGSVFIGLMTPDGAIWSRYQRAVLMR